MIEFKIAKQMRPVVLLSLTVVALFVCHAEDNHSPSSKLKIDRETTFLTCPLRTDGTVDYASSINARMKQGVTPEKNVCVLLCEAIQPLEAWDMLDDFFKEIERKPPTKDHRHVRYLTAEIPDPSSEAEKQRLYHVIEFIQGDPRPWKRSEFPEVAGVLDGDNEPLKIVLAAAERDQFYSPIITRGLDGVDPLPLVAVMDPMTTQFPYLVQSLRLRAMLNLGEGNHNASWEDLLACFKLARLLGMGPSKLHAQCSYMLEERNCSAIEAYIHQTDPLASQANYYLKALQSLPSLPRLSERVDLFERCAYLDALMVIRTNQEGAIAYLDCEPGLAATGKMVNLFWKDAIDWNKTLQVGNRYYNRLVKILEMPDLDRRRDEATALRQELKSLAEKAIGIRGADDTASVDATTESKSELLAAIVAVNLMSDIDKCLASEIRVKQRFANLEMTLSRAANRKDLGEPAN